MCFSSVFARIYPLLLSSSVSFPLILCEAFQLATFNTSQCIRIAKQSNSIARRSVTLSISLYNRVERKLKISLMGWMLIILWEQNPTSLLIRFDPRISEKKKLKHKRFLTPVSTHHCVQERATQACFYTECLFFTLVTENLVKWTETPRKWEALCDKEALFWFNVSRRKSGRAAWNRQRERGSTVCERMERVKDREEVVNLREKEIKEKRTASGKVL